MRPARLAGLGLLASAVACGPPAAEQRPVVLWEAGVVRPRFPVAPEAAWEPAEQRSRRAGEPGVGERDLVACYSARSTDEVVSFYAPIYGVDPVAIAWRQLADRPGTRRAELPQAGDLPQLLLESPYRGAGSAVAADGALICMVWREPGTGPAGGAG